MAQQLRLLGGCSWAASWGCISGEGKHIPSGAVDRAVSLAEGKQLYHYMLLVSQGAKLADSPKLGSTFDFLIYRLMHMLASLL